MYLGLEFVEYSFHVHDSLQGGWSLPGALTPLIVDYTLSACSTLTIPKFTSLLLQACVNDVFAWNTQNMLKSNPGKTDILHFTSRFKKQPSSLDTLMLANSTKGIKAKAKNLGVVMDKILSFNDYINEICKKASFAIRSIGHIH